MNDPVWKSDLGNGTYQNPILFADYSDPDVIRVGETYYMTASSFNFTPGLPILISKDLVNWELVNYALDSIPGSRYDVPVHAAGVWAPAIRFHNQKFYIYFGMPDEGIYMVSATDPLGKWEKPVLVLAGKGLIDPCPFWDQDGTAYVVHGYAKSRIGFKSFLGIFPMSDDGQIAVGEDHFIYNGVETQPTIEGPKIYQRDSFYYIFAPAGGVKTGWQTVLRSTNIRGPYEAKIVMHQGNSKVNGPHQGGLVTTPSNEAWFIHFQERGCYGRIVHLQPVKWQKGWPVIGINGEKTGVGEPCRTHKKPDTGYSQLPVYLNASDDFSKEELNLMWQWMGNSREEFYSLSERAGNLRLYCINTGQKNSPIIWNTPNVLTQKLIYPHFMAEICMQTTGMEMNQQSGVVMIGGEYVSLAVRKDHKGLYLIKIEAHQENSVMQEQVTEIEQLAEEQHQIWFRFYLKEQEQGVVFTMEWSIDGEIFGPVSTSFTPVAHTWAGAKIGLYAMDLSADGKKGYADFNYIRVIPDDSLQLTDKIKSRDLDGLKDVLVKDPSLIEGCDQQGVPLSFIAAQMGALELVKYIVEYSRASMDETDREHKNILHYAAMSGSVELCQYLVERVGMDLFQGDLKGITPFEIAKRSAYPELEQYFETAAGGSFDQMYQNPIRMGMFPDPSIVRVKEDYYMVNSSFIYFPCIPISHSRDLIHWHIIGHAITNPEWSGLGDLEGGRGYWAPDISYDEGRFYITATYRMNDNQDLVRKQMVVTAENPQGPYSCPVYLDEDGIDPSLFHEDGRHYMLLNRGARIFEINKAGSRILSEPHLLYYGSQKHAPEGPHLLKKDGYYYLFMAEGGTGSGHRITVARSQSIDGIYQPCPYNPIMRQSDHQAAIQRCGHGKPVSTPNGEWFMVYLCARMVSGKYSILGRETALDPICWTSDGWPLINGGKGPSVLQRKPKLPMSIPEKEGGITLCPLSKGWIFPREPDQDAVQYDGGSLLLKGSAYPMSDVKARNILLHRQTDFVFESGVTLALAPMKEDQEIGVTGYYDENTWYSFGLVKRAGSYFLKVTEHIGEQERNYPLVKINQQMVSPPPESADRSTVSPPPESADRSKEEFLQLRMKINYLKRDLFYIDPIGKEILIKSLENVYYLCDEGLKRGKRFTGAMIGLYVYGGKDLCYGRFRDFYYKSIDERKSEFKKM